MGGSPQILRGRVLNPSGSPLPDAHLHRFSLRAGSRVVRIKSRADGSFEMPIGIPAVVLGYSQMLGAAAAPATGYEPSFDLRLQPRVEIRGRVVGPDGAPREGLRISQMFVLKFADKLVYLSLPMKDRVEKRGANAYIVPCFCFAGVTTTDLDGSFLLFGLPPCNGKVLLNITAQEGTLLTASDTVWVDPSGTSDIVFREGQGPYLRLPDGASVFDLPLEDPDPAVQEEPLPAVEPDPRDERREWIKKLREEANHDSGGHPPTRRSRRTDLIPEFARALEDPDPELRTQAICALAYMNAPETLETQVAALQNGNWSVRSYALMGLGWLGRDPGLRARVVAALRRVVDEGDPSISIPLSAAGTLVELGEAPDPAMFYEALRRKDGDEIVAASALAGLLKRDAVELILARMETSEHRRFLGQSLETLTGAKHGESLARWKSWFEANRQTLPAQAPLEDRLSDARAYFMRAVGRYERKDLRGARSDLDAAVALDERRPQILALRARVRMMLGDPDGALGDADLAVKHDPGQSVPLSIRAWIREQRGDPKGAAEDLEKAIELLPPGSKALAELQERLKKLR